MTRTERQIKECGVSLHSTARKFSELLSCKLPPMMKQFLFPTSSIRHFVKLQEISKTLKLVEIPPRISTSPVENYDCEVQTCCSGSTVYTLLIFFSI